MTRREALLSLTALVGGTVFGAGRFLSGNAFAADAARAAVPGPKDFTLLEEVAETILPATPTSGGAKEARVGAFMAEIARDYYDPAERELLAGSADFFDRASGSKFDGRGFLSLTPEERHGLLVDLDGRKPQPPAYRMVKQLTLWGYWSSDVAAKQALTYLPVPGVYRGCVDVEPGAKAMF